MNTCLLLQVSFSLPPTHRHTRLFLSLFHFLHLPSLSLLQRTHIHTHIHTTAQTYKLLHLLFYFFSLPHFSYHYFHACNYTQAPVFLSCSLSPALSIPITPSTSTHPRTHTYFLSVCYWFSHSMSLPQPCTHTHALPAVQLPLLPAGLGQLSSSGLSGPSGVQCPLLCWSPASHWASQDEHSIFKHNLYASKLCCVSSDPAEWSHWISRFPPQRRLILLWWHLCSLSLMEGDWRGNWLKPPSNLTRN